MKRNFFFTCITVALAATSLQAQNISPRIIASTSWVAAIARAAGATDIVTLAPMDLQHPPEYELKPSDLLRVRGADFLVYSGYERFAKRLAETAQADGLIIAEVYTDNIPTTLKREAKKLAILFDTLVFYQSWEASLDTLTRSMRANIQSAFPNKRVLAHKYLKTYAQWLGFEVVGTFGPGEGSPAQLMELIKAKPILIIDNYHNPSGKALQEALGIPLVTLINFPGKDGTQTIQDVFAYNEKAFLAASKAQ